MPIFSKPNAIVYVRRNGLVVAGKKLTPARMTFNPAHFNNLEVLRDTSFTEALYDFFSKNDLRGKHVLMVLDDSVVFSKRVSLDKDTPPAAIVDAFIDEMPLELGKRACLQLVSTTELSLYATNSQLYIAVADALDQAKIAKLLAITPAGAYETDGSQLAAAIQQYISDTAVRSRANFLHADIL